MRLVGLCLGSAIMALAATAPPPVTFYKDALPVLQKNCQTCHRPGESGPMSFLNYETTRPWAKAIKNAVLTKKMPPWFADPHYGKFSNDRSMAQSDIDTLVSWADTGAPAGNPKDAPNPIDWVEGWRIGKPDQVISMPVAFSIPASGTIDYQYIVIPTGFTEDKYVQLSEARPGNPAVVHHIIAFIREPGNPWLKDAVPGVPFVPRERARRAEADARKDDKPRQQDGGGFGDFLAGYAPGTLPNIMKPGQAKLVKAGSDLVLQMHYTANGKATTDISRIGIVFATGKPTERILTLAAANAEFAIPPGNSNYQVDSKLTLQDDATLINFLPHMHFRGKSFEYRVTYPSGEKETLLDVPHYDFNWQLTYELAQPKLLPKGTVIECTAHFDNSPNNRYNPDPTTEVHFGEQTWEEMMIGFMDVAVPMNKTAMDLMRPKKTAAQSGPSL
jgi:hypothetical protein